MADPIDRSRSTVLVADDDEDFRGALASELRDDGFQVWEAENGAAALELLAEAADERAAPDVVVLDVRMPGYSGLGILRALRQFESRPAVIVVTGSGDLSIDAMAVRLGAARVLHKPLDLDELRAAVVDAALGAAQP